MFPAPPLPHSCPYLWHQGLWRKRKKNKWAENSWIQPRAHLVSQAVFWSSFPPPPTSLSLLQASGRKIVVEPGEGWGIRVGLVEVGCKEKVVQNINWSCEVASWLEPDHLTSCFSSSYLFPSLYSGLELSLGRKEEQQSWPGSLV